MLYRALAYFVVAIRADFVVSGDECPAMRAHAALIHSFENGTGILGTGRT